ncbi:uncharacterized protein LOC117895712 [Drosophila subobscura]|uniref:uncharacterized protein LOC117895712 n=1 Tax=Drosophila subobscura TaxID=7241 RepID=UPI00155AF8C6|nr:uncharacterized protein LOC117895712 [Drosophila subobscura]
MSSYDFTFGGGIEFVLENISIPSSQRQSFNKDAEIIENAFIRAISRHDRTFAHAFRGLSLTGSNLDGSKIDLPDEFDMLTTMEFNCNLQPVPVAGHPGYIYLRVTGRNAPAHLLHRARSGFDYISRDKLQAWFRQNIGAIMEELQNIPCGGHRTYALKYMAHGYGVAHTIMAVCRGDRKRKIYFDFVPAFEFQAHEWPQGLPQHKHQQRTWFAVPRAIRGKHAPKDPLTFMVCAPHWERMVLEKKQNLKDTMRLMKCTRSAHHMNSLISYMIKSVFLNCAEWRYTTWNQSPGRLLIRMCVRMIWCLTQRHLPFYLVPELELFETLSDNQLSAYLRNFNRITRTLIKCRDRDRMTPEQMEFLFGISYE